MSTLAPSPPSLRKKSADRVPLSPVLEEGRKLELPPRIHRELNGIISRYVAIAFWQAGTLVLLVVGLALLFQGTLDYLANLSLIWRGLLLFLDVAALAVIAWLFPFRAWKNRPDLEGAALLMQKKWSSLRSSLVAAVQFTREDKIPFRSVRLVEMLLSQATTQIEKFPGTQVFSLRRAWQLTTAAAVTLVLTGTVYYVTLPISSLLLSRVFLSGQPLPARTTLTAISRDLTASVGDNVVLSARARGVIPDGGSVHIQYQDGTQENLPVAASTDHQGVFSLSLHNVQQSFRYRFEVNDAGGSEFSVQARRTPVIKSLNCVYASPPYTGLPEHTISSSELSLLEGGVLHLRLEASSSLSNATLLPQGTPGQIEMKIDPADRNAATADLPIPASGLVGFIIALVDQSGVASVHNAIYPIEIVADEPPTARIVSPSDESLTVTLQSKLSLVFEVSDNFGLSSVKIHFEITPASTGDQDAPAKEVAPIVVDQKQLNPKAGAISTVTCPLLVSQQNPAWHEGDTIRYWLEATDNNNVTGPGVTQSSSQRLLVVTPEEKRDEIFQRLEDNANLMQDVVNAQKDLNDQTKNTSQEH